MARGKYSPTVEAAYASDQEWFHRYSREAEEWTSYDPEGYDSYGYDKNDVDRAGNHENDYLWNDAPSGSEDNYNLKYDEALKEWGFDGEKPVSTKPLTVEQRLLQLLPPTMFPNTKGWAEADLVGRVELLLEMYDRTWG